MEIDELGELGEKQLGILASQAQLVLNPVQRDRTGFDGILELRSVPSAPAADLVPSAFRAFIQVKTTQSVQSSVRITLSNWQRMISDPSPWFVFVLQVDHEGVAQVGFLVHVDKILIERALKALRESENDLTRKLSVSYSDEHRLERLHGSALRQCMLEAIGRDSFVYQQEKNRFFKTCGYEGNPFRVTVKFPDVPREQLIHRWTEIALGDRQSLEFAGVKVEDCRFGKKVTRSDFPIGEGTLRLSPPPRRGRLHVEAADRLNWVSLPVEIYSTLSIPHIPANLGKYRVKAGPLSITMPLDPNWNERGEFDATLSDILTFDEATPCSVFAAADAAKALRLLADEGARILLSLETKTPGDRFLLGQSNAGSFSDEQIAELEEWIAAGQVAARVGLQDLQVSPQEILAGYPRLTLLHALLSNQLRDLEFTLDLGDDDLPGERAVIMCPAAAIGDKAIVACVALFATPERRDRKLTFKPERVRVGDIGVVPRNALSSFPFENAVKELGSSLAELVGTDRIIYPREMTRPLILGPEELVDAADDAETPGSIS